MFGNERLKLFGPFAPRRGIRFVGDTDGEFRRQCDGVNPFEDASKNRPIVVGEGFIKTALPFDKGIEDDIEVVQARG